MGCTLNTPLSVTYTSVYPVPSQTVCSSIRTLHSEQLLVNVHKGTTVILLPVILIKLFLEQKMWNMYNRMKLPFFGLNVRLLFTDLIWIRIRIRFRIRIRIRIQNVYFDSGSDSAKSFGSFRIRFRFRIRICNTAIMSVCRKVSLLCTIRYTFDNLESWFLYSTRTWPSKLVEPDPDW